jgi:hypothetical protein
MTTRPAPRARLSKHRHDVGARDRGVLAPQQDVARVEQVEEVVALLLAEVEQLRGVARPRADVAALGRHRAEAREEGVDQREHRAERAAAAVMEDRGRAGLAAERREPLSGEVEGLVPGDRCELAPPSQQRLRQPVGAVLGREEARGAVAEKAAGHRMVGVAAQAGHPAMLDLGDDATGVRTVAVAEGLAKLGHAPRVARRAG